MQVKAVLIKSCIIGIDMVLPANLSRHFSLKSKSYLSIFIPCNANDSRPVMNLLYFEYSDDMLLSRLDFDLIYLN